MAFTKGNKLAGSRKGKPNKATTSAREAIARFVDGNAHRLQEWLEEVAREDGARAAASLYVDMVEFSVPKLARTELTGKDGEALNLTVTPTDGSL